MDSNIFDNLTQDQDTHLTDLILDPSHPFLPLNDDSSHFLPESDLTFPNQNLVLNEALGHSLELPDNTHFGLSKNDVVTAAFPTQYDLTFSGGLWPTPSVLEVQLKGDCGAQMLEKMAQLHYGDTEGIYNSPQHHLADAIQQYAKEHNPNIIQQLFLGEQRWGVSEPPDPYTHLSAFALDPAKYTSILHILGIETHWSDFSHPILVEELNAHKPVGVILDAQYLTGYGYPAEYSPHAITLTGTYYNTQGQLMYYGIDTNFERVCIWPAHDIEKAIEASAMMIPNSEFYGKVLLSDRPARSWPYPIP